MERLCVGKLIDYPDGGPRVKSWWSQFFWPLPWANSVETPLECWLAYAHLEEQGVCLSRSWFFSYVCAAQGSQWGGKSNGIDTDHISTLLSSMMMCSWASYVLISPWQMTNMQASSSRHRSQPQPQFLINHNSNMRSSVPKIFGSTPIHYFPSQNHAGR